MNNLRKILNGLNLYPVIKDKHVNIVLKINMKEEYKEIFGLDCTFKEFIDEIKGDKLTKYIAKEVLYQYYGFKKLPIITDSSYENWYFINYTEKTKSYNTLNLIDRYGSMNTYSMMEDYTDLFNNRIKYKVA